MGHVGWSWAPLVAPFKGSIFSRGRPAADAMQCSILQQGTATQRRATDVSNLQKTQRSIDGIDSTCGFVDSVRIDSTCYELLPCINLGINGLATLQSYAKLMGAEFKKQTLTSDCAAGGCISAKSARTFESHIPKKMQEIHGLQSGSVIHQWQ